MKHIKRYIVLILAVMALAVSWFAVSVFAAGGDMRYGRTKLSADLQTIYDALVTGCASAQAEIEINISGRNIDFDQDLKKTFMLFYSDYPEYFWVTGGWDCSYTSELLVMKPHYSIPDGDLSAAKAKYEVQVNKMISGIIGSDYQKAKALHDRLVEKVDYAGTANDQNAYGALVEGKAVCNGYARAYQHLMNKVGIPAWYVMGDSINPKTNKSIAHAWNLVKIDGDWYYTDVTWDDQGENTFYAYFHITEQQLLKDHSLRADYAALVPQSTAVGANYYKKESREFAGYDQNKLVNLLKKDGNKTQIYVNGDADAFAAAVNANILSIGEQLGGRGAFQISYRYFRLGNALIFDLVLISEEGHTHSPKTFVQQVEATCLQNGIKAHYICDCKMAFLDEACTNRVIDDTALKIPVRAHTPSGYKNNRADHWKECTECGSEIADSHGTHGDQNGDNRCDICSYALPITGSGNSGVGSETPGSTGSASADNSDTPTTTVGDADASSSQENSTEHTEDNAGDSAETVGDESTSTTVSDGSETAEQKEPSATVEETPVCEDSADHNSWKAAIWLCAGIVVVASGVGAALILFKKKKK